jgi:SAM-dependent methyltransferase
MRFKARGIMASIVRLESTLKPRESVVTEEKRFWTEGLGRYTRARQLVDRAIGEFTRAPEMHLHYDPRGKKVLDYGCGNGYLSVQLLERGAQHVTGIDISESQLEQARRAVEARGFADRARFLVTDAHATGFPDRAFDLIVGVGILHHLDVERALREVRRILAPDGRAVFLEPLAHNPLLRLGRAITPSARTEDEHPLTEDDWRLCASIFPGLRHHELELLSIALMPVNLLLPRRAQQALAPKISALDDRFIAARPSLRKHCRVTVLVLQ